MVGLQSFVASYIQEQKEILKQTKACSLLLSTMPQTKESSYDILRKDAAGLRKVQKDNMHYWHHCLTRKLSKSLHNQRDLYQISKSLLYKFPFKKSWKYFISESIFVTRIILEQKKNNQRKSQYIFYVLNRTAICTKSLPCFHKLNSIYYFLKI